MIWLNGRMTSREAPHLDASDRGLLLGDGLFETMRAYNGRVFRLDAHLARLAAGLKRIGVPLVLDRAQIAAAIAETLAANGLAGKDGSLRLTVTRGPGPRGLMPPVEVRPTMLISAHPLAPPPRAPATAIVTAIRRNEHSPLANLKTLSYLEHVLARQEASSRGADEALFLNTAGRLADASAANLFLVARGGGLVTPPVEEGVLPGVTRAAVLQLATTLGIRAEERPVEIGKLRAAGEAFLTNTLIQVRPLVRVDGRTVGTGEPGPVTRRLQDAYRDLVRRELGV